MEPKDRKPHINLDYFEDQTGDIPKPDREISEEIGGRIKKLGNKKAFPLMSFQRLQGLTRISFQTGDKNLLFQ